ncbi:THUMP domain-containing class I SAM-dependent RNA methyltransferase [Mangrovicoccus algicola]|uniref:Class I SAM-dependent RNA methyltransferase n=1 Tax=Mangrovicoccus algicola TaxID=2771008 RepID=A0A8J7CGC2_9RHOB|nr:class I SAM-dependent RNA methyltransferase [Mangrovicoccus algicola]MBE3636960.1 class I SAM-dependent RNA methyltransferase [Mangrovicoccus algicola]
MSENDDYELFLVAAPGLEPDLAREAAALGLSDIAEGPGGVTARGDRAALQRANLHLRCASRVLLRFAAFRAPHLAQLDKRARRLAWDRILPPGLPVRVEAVCKRSRIYHQGAAAERIGAAIADGAGATIAADAATVVKARIEDDLCTLSLDTSGEPLHRRGHKEAVGKAPLRETLAAAFLARMGFDGSQTVVDPMCGSGTFPIEAAEIAAGLAPGRSRRFAFEDLGGFDAEAWDAMKAAPVARAPVQRFFGHDRDDGAIRMATQNARRAGVEGWTAFSRQPISDLAPPPGPPGLVMVNPPYGARIGERKLLFALYGTLGRVLSERFAGWRLGMVTSDPGLAKATGLSFLPADPPVSLGGLKVALYRTAPLGR